jgi:hypothetical protein
MFDPVYSVSIFIILFNIEEMKVFSIYFLSLQLSHSQKSRNPLPTLSTRFGILEAWKSNAALGLLHLLTFCAKAWTLLLVCWSGLGGLGDVRFGGFETWDFGMLVRKRHAKPTWMWDAWEMFRWNEARGIFVYHFLEGWNNGKEGSALRMIQSDTTDKTQLNLPSQPTQNSFSLTLR